MARAVCRRCGRCRSVSRSAVTRTPSARATAASLASRSATSPTDHDAARGTICSTPRSRRARSGQQREHLVERLRGGNVDARRRPRAAARPTKAKGAGPAARSSCRRLEGTSGSRKATLTWTGPGRLLVLTAIARETTERTSSAPGLGSHRRRRGRATTTRRRRMRTWSDGLVRAAGVGVKAARSAVGAISGTPRNDASTIAGARLATAEPLVTMTARPADGSPSRDQRARQSRHCARRRARAGAGRWRSSASARRSRAPRCGCPARKSLLGDAARRSSTMTRAIAVDGVHESSPPGSRGSGSSRSAPPHGPLGGQPGRCGTQGVRVGVADARPTGLPSRGSVVSLGEVGSEQPTCEAARRRLSRSAAAASARPAYSPTSSPSRRSPWADRSPRRRAASTPPRSL